MGENKWIQKRRRWARLLEEFADSGLTIGEFAKQRGLSLRSLQRRQTMARRGEWDPSAYLDDGVEREVGAPKQVDMPPAPPLTPLEGLSAEPPSDEPSILPIRLIEPPCAPLAYELTFGGRQLRLPHDFEVQRVARLVRALEGGAC